SYRRGRDPITNDDVQWLLQRAGAYVVEDLGPGQRSVYRPFHDLLAAHLRGEPDAGPEADQERWRQHRTTTEQAITDALLTTLYLDGSASRHWMSAHP